MEKTVKAMGGPLFSSLVRDFRNVYMTVGTCLLLSCGICADYKHILFFLMDGACRTLKDIVSKLRAFYTVNWLIGRWDLGRMGLRKKQF